MNITNQDAQERKLKDHVAMKVLPVIIQLQPLAEKSWHISEAFSYAEIYMQERKKWVGKKSESFELSLSLTKSEGA